MTEYVAIDLQQAMSQSISNQYLSTKQADKYATAMNTSLASTLDDSTPSDSGVQLLDSVSSMNVSLMSNSGFDFDLTPKSLDDDDECPTTNISSINQLPDLLLMASLEPNTTPEVVVANPLAQNIDVAAHIPDEMKTSVCSTFDPEPIVYRRKTKKTQKQHSAGGPKKRVSFHEDILKNTKTDNIHIEHGFITYKGYSNKQHPPIASSRYSWCPEGAAGQRKDEAASGDDVEDYEDNKQYYYRNACSDVLDYGKTDLYEKEIPGELR